jgi:hypothetical protein
MKEEKIGKYWEPFFHVVPLILELLASVWPLVAFGNIKTTGYSEPWCVVEEGPFTKFFLIVSQLLLLSSILLGFTLIICRAAKIERELNKALRRRDGSSLRG